MKLYVTKDDTSIENFTTVKLQNFEKDMENVISNSCELIAANDVLDYVPVDKMSQFISSLVSKLRKNGKITINGTDGLLLCVNVVDGNMTTLEFSKNIQYKACLMSSSELKEIMEKLGVKIESLTIKGTHYELVGKR